VQYAEPVPRPFPWRAATLVAVAVAVVELVALIVVGALVLARPLDHHARVANTPARRAQVHAVSHAPRVKPLPSHPLLPRAAVSVLVLNGNGVSGAAGREAATLHGLGYRIAAATNAQRHDYARSMVMYLPAFAHEARRLARETGIGLVSPVDGLTPRALRGVKLVVLLGN
jgi:LytR cell envelope-related transcriptional attenuator